MNKLMTRITAALLTASLAVSSIGTTASAYSGTFNVSGYTATANNTEETISKNFNNSSYYTRLDKWGRAYSYHYYKYADDYYIREMYERIYNALYERKSSVEIPKEEYDVYYKKIRRGISNFVLDICSNCPDFYYIKDVKKESTDSGVKLTFTYNLSEDKIKENDKKIAKVISHFNEYLEEHNVTTTEEFLQAALDYLGETVSYDYGSMSRSKLTDSDTIVGPFIKGKALCGGYVQAFNYLCATYGIPYAFFLTDGINISGMHAMSMIPINNVWLIFDATWAHTPDHQFVTEEQLKKDAQYKFVRYKQRGEQWLAPISDGTELPVTIALEAPKSEEASKTETPVKTEKPKSDTKSIKLKDSHLKSFKTFKSVYAKYYKIVKESEMTSLKITVPEDKVSTAVKYIQKMKKDGDYSYSKIYKGKNYVKVVL